VASIGVAMAAMTPPSGFADKSVTFLIG
jgi:hypothetical protein